MFPKDIFCRFAAILCQILQEVDPLRPAPRPSRLSDLNLGNGSISVVPHITGDPIILPLHLLHLLRLAAALLSGPTWMIVA